MCRSFDAIASPRPPEKLYFSSCYSVLLAVRNVIIVDLNRLCQNFHFRICDVL
jgi:hypothetical protein